jgi:glycerol-3-phosphate dehydrogenase subunit C
MRAQGIGNPSVKMLELIPGTTVKYVSEECCGMGGAYGYEKKNFELSKDIAGKLYNDVKDNPCDRIVTDCGGCKLQIQAGTGTNVEHPLILLQEAYK